ncbi:hypothetical protein EsDP_00006317 [Epichloe bromicola]|uniref:BZIP domain-containing protein n=1 Tax=Epichloe bromicola TaxID=79588 RepID=A0ABQ0CX96_9HYPO
MFPPPASGLSPQASNRNRNRRRNSRTSATSSLLPNPAELSLEDDWTRVKCPKEKKRIQNRVAQRTYRHRMKARLGELQARLDNHERQRIENAAHSTGHAPDSAAASTGAGTLNQNVAMTNEQRRSTMPIPPTGSGVQEHVMEDSEPAFYAHNAQYLRSPPNSHHSPQAPDGLLSPPGRPDFEQQSDEACQDFFVLDCLPFQSQLVHRLSTMEQDAAPYPGQPQYNSSPGSSLPQGMDAMNQDHVGCMSAFTPAAHMHDLDLSFDGSRNDWTTEAFGLKTRSSPSPMIQMSFPQMPDLPDLPDARLVPALELEPMPDSCCILPPPPRASPSPPEARGSRTEETVESVMRRARDDAGFDTFEDVATAHCETSFGNASAPSTEQHPSRGRRREILRTVTATLGSEASRKQSQLASRLLSTDAASSSVAESLESMKKIVQQELPNSWALNEALASERGTGSSADGSNVVLAAILLQQFSGRVPKKQLLRVVEACI